MTSDYWTAREHDDPYEKAVAQAERREAARAIPPRRPAPITAPTLEQIIAFENEPHRSRAGDILHTFGMNATRYHQHLNRAIDTPEMLAADPTLTKRLLNQRARRMAERAARTFTRGGAR